MLGIDPNTYPQVASLDFNNGQADEAFAALGTGATRSSARWRWRRSRRSTAATSVMQTAEGAQTYHVVGVASDVLTFKVDAVFISQANLAADFHKNEDVMMLMNLKPGADKTGGAGGRAADRAGLPAVHART